MIGKVQVWNMALSRIGETKFLESGEEDTNAVRVCALHWDRIIREVLERRRWPWAIGMATLSELTTQTASHEGDGAQTDFAINFDLPDNAAVTVTVDGTEQEIETDYTVEYPEGEGIDPYVSFTVAPAAAAAIVITYTPTYNGWGRIYSLPADFVSAIALVPEDTKVESIPPEGRIPFTIAPNDGNTGYVLLTDAEQGEDFERLAYVRMMDKPHLWKGSFTSAVAWYLAAELATGLPKDPQRSIEWLRMYEATLAGAAAQSFNEGQRSQPLKTPTVRARR